MKLTNILVAGLLLTGAQLAAAKGLEALSESNPENAEDDADAEAGKTVGKDGGKLDKSGVQKADAEQKAEKAEAPLVKSATSKSLAGKLSVSTSFGWVKASRGEGTWHTSGMSDVSIGYKVAALNPQMSVDGTYRYAPIAMSGELKGQSYRGVWEMHNFGGLLHYAINDSMTAVGAAELGYVASHVRSLDGIKAANDATKGGVSVGVGGGGDLAIGEKNTCSIGPRLRVGFGSFTSFQLAGAFNFLF